MRKLAFANNNFYHVFNRGVDKRITFLDKKDYVRFIKGLFEFNDECAHFNLHRSSEEVLFEAKPRTIPLVEVHCFCLMPNHFHLILKQVEDNGVSKFMHKVSTAYTMFFNTKYERTGSLFQGPFKAVSIQSDEQLKHTSRYIHLNPVELIERGWKKDGIKNWDKINKFIEQYRWSSYLDYIGKNNFPMIVKNKFIGELLGGGSNEYLRYMKEWAIGNLDAINTLED